MPEVVRQTEWYEDFRDFTPLVQGTSDVVRIRAAVDEGAANLKGSTVTRLIGWVAVVPTVLASVSSCAWGIIVGNSDARVVGALPNPEDISDRADWMVRDRMLVNSNSLSDSSQWARRSFDLRAQRVMRSEEDELCFVIHASATNNNTMNYAVYIRALLLLPA